MSLALVLDNELGIADLAYAGGLCNDGGLQTAVIISLFTDSRAPAHSGLAPEDRRGFWAQADLGSRLWLHRSKPLSNEVVVALRQAAEMSLKWLVDDDVAKKVVVTVTKLSRDRLKLGVEVHRGDGGTWSSAWEATATGVKPCAF